jgi:hypothetical protein
VLIAEATVATERPTRYLVQVCRHIDLVARGNPQMEANVECSDDYGVISFPWGRCTLLAGPRVLWLRAEASDEEGLLRLETRVTDRLEQIGRRDRLTVTWTPSQGASEHSTSGPTGGDHHRRGRSHD